MEITPGRSKLYESSSPRLKHHQGAHLLLQTRVRTLNGELGVIFKRWYPDMDLEVEEMPVAS